MLGPSGIQEAVFGKSAKQIKAIEDLKNKEEAIDALTGSTKVKEDIEIGSILLLFNDGTELGFGMNKDLLKKIMNLVAKLLLTKALINFLAQWGFIFSHVQKGRDMAQHLGRFICELA
jgi:hypothetical protein